ncbi:MAG: ABC transporter substrate-binding protein [Gemmatimonadales bacterium]|nr:ABC transporter substrate-binding protein [Gemmatimonadales bacterium]
MLPDLRRLAGFLLPVALLLAACGGASTPGVVEVTLPVSVLGAEAEVLRRQLRRFMEEHPDIRVVQRETPDAADQRHQLYVQWLNAGASDPDILQLDVVWTPEFAAAGWILPLERFAPDTSAFFPTTVSANRWGDSLFALPWFVDVGMLYWRTDLMAAPPTTFDGLVSSARAAKQRHGLRHGLVWQGARYEGLVTTFLEYLGGHGGRIMEQGRVVVASAAGRQALREMRSEIHESGIVPTAALTWHEEETRFAFQNGESAFMRNWPYAYGLMQDSAQSRVAGRFAVAPMPATPDGTPTAALGGAQLAINRNTEHPEAAWRVIDYLTRPEQMLERARVVGQFPTRAALYDDPELAAALSIPPAQARRVIEHAVARPVTPIYTQLSDILQVHLHRALTRQREPAAALAQAQAEMQQLLNRVGLGIGGPPARR